MTNITEGVKMSNENGFSLIELAVSCAILTALTAVAASYYVTAGNNIIQQVEDVKAMQAANPDVTYLVTFE